MSARDGEDATEGDAQVSADRGRNLSRALERAGRMRSRADRFIVAFKEMRKLACFKSEGPSSGWDCTFAMDHEKRFDTY